MQALPTALLPLPTCPPSRPSPTLLPHAQADKVYVQHLMQQHAAELHALIAE